MSEDFATAEERARLAAADLLAAANDVIRVRSVRWDHVRDEVDAALVSRRWTGYAPSGMRRLDDARDDQAFADRVLAEIRSIVASRGATPAGGSADTVATDAAVIGRLDVLATECERRAVRLRS